MNARDLKNSILQLAVQGKLVEQIEEEGTAKELLDMIEIQKVEMRKPKKKEKSIAIEKEEIPFDIPQNWEWTRLSDILQIINGDRGKNYPSKETLSNQGIPFISALNIYNNSISKDKLLYMSEDQYNKLGSGKLLKGDIVLCIRGSLGKNGRYPFDQGAIASSLVILRSYLDEEIFYEYISYYINSGLFFNEILKYNNGTAQPNLGARDLAKFLIPLPPLSEQKRIVEKIKMFESYIQKYNSIYFEVAILNKEFLKNLPKSILQYAVQGKLVEQDNSDEPASKLLKQISNQKEKMIKEKIIKKEKSLPPITEEEIPFDIPDTWEWVRIGDIGAWRAGSTPSRSNPMYYNGEIPWIKTGELNDGYINESNEHISTLALENCSLPLNKPGSVLIAMYGATIGKVGILNISATTNQACCATYPFEGVYNKYLLYYLLSMRDHFRSSATGGAQPNISKEKLIKTLIPLPPFNEQVKIANKLDEILPLIENKLVF